MTHRKGTYSFHALIEDALCFRYISKKNNRDTTNQVHLMNVYLHKLVTANCKVLRYKIKKKDMNLILKGNKRLAQRTQEQTVKRRDFREEEMM